MEDQISNTKMLTKPQDSEAQYETDIENVLSVCQANLESDEDSRQYQIEAICGIIALKNLIAKYLPSEEEEVLPDGKTRRSPLGALNYMLYDGQHGLENNPWRARSYITTVNEHYRKILKDLGFGIPTSEIKDWHARMLEQYQIDTLEWNDPIFKTPMLNPSYGNVILRQSSYIDNFATLRMPQDRVVLVSGTRGQGKSNLALWKLLYWHQDRGDDIDSRNNIRDWLKNEIVYTHDPDLPNKMMEMQQQVLICDEAMFSWHNLKTLRKESVTLSENLNATRSRRNFYIFCISNLSDAIKGLQRVANSFYIIPKIGQANLYAKSRVYEKANDPLSIKDLNDAKWNNQVDFHLTNNPNYICNLKYIKIDDWIEEEYNKNKASAQIAKAQEDRAHMESVEQHDALIAQAVKAIEEGDEDPVSFFINKGADPKQAGKLAKESLERLKEKQMLAKAKEAEKDA